MNVAEQAEEIIDEEVERMMLRLKTREVAPTIVEPAGATGTRARRAKSNGCARKLGALPPQQEEAIEAITRGIVNKIAHAPITELRRKANDPEGIQLMPTIRKLFRLGEG